jgi:hypothetical protein
LCRRRVIRTRIETAASSTADGTFPFDDTSREWVVQGYADAGGFLFGRRTYQNLAACWPNASKEEQVIAEPLNTKPKYVASRTLAEPLEWQKSMLLRGDLARAVRRGGPGPKRDRQLRIRPNADRTRPGGPMPVDIDPLVVGGGKRLFRNGGAAQAAAPR